MGAMCRQLRLRGTVCQSTTPPLRHSAFCIDGCDLSMLYRQGADDLDLHGASSSGSATMLSLRRAWLVKDADDPSIFSAFGKKQAAQTFAPAAGCRLAVINPHPQKQNVPVRQVVSRAGSRNKGWANRRLRVCDGVFSLGNDGEGKFLDKNYSGDESKFLGCWWPCLDADRSNFMLLDQGAPEQPRH
jgi:hypothetical protein